ncbi:hypothetical protein BDV19DRAFT_374313 [Aspergillus venezuelensis]
MPSVMGSPWCCMKGQWGIGLIPGDRQAGIDRARAFGALGINIGCGSWLFQGIQRMNRM